MTEVVACASPPPVVSVAAWLRGERPTVSYRPLSISEPVVSRGGRAHPSPVDAQRLDALVHAARVRTTDPRQVIGAKPAAFCWWVFDLLGALPGDEARPLCRLVRDRQALWGMTDEEMALRLGTTEARWIAKATARRIPFLFKQTGSVLAKEWGLRDAKGEDPGELPVDLRVRQWPAPLAGTGGALL